MEEKTKIKYTYNQLFRRNVGIFSKKQQQKIRKLKIAIAGGGGGLGGVMAYNLARVGIKEIRLIDPDIFEPSNINRQFGAYIDTIGQYKVEAIKNELLRINPYLRVKIWSTKLDKSNIGDFLRGIDGVIDSIDFFELESANYLYREARKRKLWVFTCQGAINIISVVSFNQGGITFEEMVTENGKLSLRKAILTMFPILPKGATEGILNKVIKGARKRKNRGYHIPSYALLPPFGGALVTEEIIKALIKDTAPIAEAPNLFLVDLESMKTFLFKNGKLKKN